MELSHEYAFATITLPNTKRSPTGQIGIGMTKEFRKSSSLLKNIALRSGATYPYFFFKVQYRHIKDEIVAFA